MVLSTQPSDCRSAVCHSQTHSHLAYNSLIVFPSACSSPAAVYRCNNAWSSLSLSIVVDRVIILRPDERSVGRINNNTALMKYEEALWRTGGGGGGGGVDSLLLRQLFHSQGSISLFFNRSLIQFDAAAELFWYAINMLTLLFIFAKFRENIWQTEFRVLISNWYESCCTQIRSLSLYIETGENFDRKCEVNVCINIRLTVSNQGKNFMYPKVIW